MNKLKITIEETIDYLSSRLAVDSLNRDPYWPKWDSPWWRSLLLFEIGQGHLVPRSIAEQLVEKINTHYLHFFPFCEDEIPKDKDPYRHILCHCALGSVYKFFRSYFSDIDSMIPWARAWFIKYQLLDGGLNCDEQAYTKSKKSSVTSSLPALEAILSCASTGLTENEILFLDKGAEYLIKHKLVYSLSGKIMDDNFLKLQFPRFYSYDILRGISFLVEWRRFRNKSDANEVIEFGYNIIAQKFPDKILKIEKSEFNKYKTLLLSDSNEWVWGNARTFPLLDDLSKSGIESKYLSEEFVRIQSHIR